MLQTMAPRIGTSGTKGVRNGRTRFGWERRRIQTPIETSRVRSRIGADYRTLDGGNWRRHAMHLSPIRFERSSQDCHGDDRGLWRGLRERARVEPWPWPATVSYRA